jgi:glutamate/tyrosine decarboxylase-like PLP-dependent enzyme
LPEEAINIDPDLFGIPETGINLEQINDTLQSLYSTSMNPANPQYIGHMDSIPALTSIIGDMVASTINNNLLSLEMSPFLTKLEYGLIKQFATLFGLPESAGGVFLSGGSLSNLQALVVARNSFKNNIALSKLVIFVSEHAHVSIQKAAMVMGLRTENVIKITTNSKYQMDVANLELQIKKQQEQGNLPLAIVATAGTTVTGSIDPLESIANLARTYGIWLHIDAIYGGALIFSDKYKHLLSGIEKADSIAFNPQKWLYIAKTC